MSDFSMPLWLALLNDEEWWEQLDNNIRQGDDPLSWTARAVDEILSDEEPPYDDDDTKDVFPF